MLQLCFHATFFGDIAKAHKVFYQAIRAAEKIKDYNKVMESFMPWLSIIHR